MHDEHDMSTSRNLNPKSSLNAGAAFGSPAMHAADASGKFMHADQLGDVGGHPGEFNRTKTGNFASKDRKFRTVVPDL